MAERRCLVGIKGCECDYNPPEWIAEMASKGVALEPVNNFCECHDCYVCGEINCGGHEADRHMWNVLAGCIVWTVFIFFGLIIALAILG